MIIQYSKNFIKQAQKLNPHAKQALQARLELFAQNPTAPQLRNHQLRGKHRTYRSINITGDVRALYTQRGTHAIFDQVGTHSNCMGSRQSESLVAFAS